MGTDANEKYFAELERRFLRVGIEAAAPQDDRMAVLLDGQEVVVVTPQGAMRVREQYLDDREGREL